MAGPQAGIRGSVRALPDAKLRRAILLPRRNPRWRIGVVDDDRTLLDGLVLEAQRSFAHALTVEPCDPGDSGLRANYRGDAIGYGRRVLDGVAA